VTNVLVNERGAVLINKLLSIDGHENSISRVVTHAHSDHIRDLDKSLTTCKNLVGTPLTLDWLVELGYKIPRDYSIRLDYGSRISIGELKLELVKTLHIPGSSQVVVTDEDGLKIVYTSDFKKPGVHTPILEADILVLDAVYGNPNYVREFDEYIEDILTDLVNQLLSKGPVIIYGYHGKLQEVMKIFRDRGVIAPYVLPPKVYGMTKIAEKYDLRIRDYVLLGSSEGAEVVKSGWFLLFTHVSSSNYIRGPRASEVLLSGWEFKKPYRYLGSNRWLVAFSDHADFKGLIHYIINSNPKTVIVNSVRSSYSEIFANEVRRITKKECIVMP